MTRILHITAHLGGGVGKVLSRLCGKSVRPRSDVQHTIICMEHPQKSEFRDYVLASGSELLVCPSSGLLNRRVAEADIVQVEWWHHPVVAGWLCAGVLPPMRLVVWSHVSGLHPPEIPLGFLLAPHRFLFTSPCSWEHPRIIGLDGEQRHRIDVVHSSGGFEDLSERCAAPRDGPIRVGYVGTLNFSKLHPELLDFLEAVPLPKFRLTLVGDLTAGEQLISRAASRHLTDRLELPGYKADVATELARFDVLAYLLNPLHYGTTENALLEAMAMGVVPVVLNNPAERHLVTHGETGLIVDSPAAFAEALVFLEDHPDKRNILSANASVDVRERFALQRTISLLETHYRAVLEEPKRVFDFRSVFGGRPSDWFLACQGSQVWRFKGNKKHMELTGKSSRGPHYLYEKTKSSVFHYHHTYPHDRQLESWAQNLEAR
ncbi:MAG: hypothetical protein AUK55_00580 [Syntrophobacteraceae bacterium CG2_30_61_12]|nr:MAG: hypothetical protein AUK55_00580 [Syntrophobacteraceae bacterium CG2_30_61_12]